jgi:hypothetical protein
MDGVRQDFVVTEKPASEGGLKVQLAVVGARVEQTTYGAQLVLDKSGRKIAYSRLHVTDATGKELPVRVEVETKSAIRNPQSATGLAVVVNDAGAVYPVRIDPTFSDANWTALGLGMNNQVRALSVSGSTLYAGGYFTTAGGVTANYVAQWDGSSWNALGSGMNNTVRALAVSGNKLYAGGLFTTAGGVTANYVAQWDGSNWSPVGSGMNTNVYVLAVSGGTLYAGGPRYVAQWNGSSWSTLGPGMNGSVVALAISGSTLYAGGNFFTPGGAKANYVAQWGGTDWIALGSGVDGPVNALAVSGNTLYVGGTFSFAGSVTANYVAQWNGNSWSALGSGMGGGSGGYPPYVNALAVSGSTLYAGGWFTTAGGVAANYMAQWNGSCWSALGLGINGDMNPLGVNALEVSDNTLYVGGQFTTAGEQVSPYIAKATIGAPTILTQPQNTNVMAGSNAGFNVGADGPPLAYQWFKDNGGLADGGNVSGSASNQLSLTNVYVNDPDSYLVVVSNNFGSVTSSVATLTLTHQQALSVVPGNQAITNNRFSLNFALSSPAGSNVVVYASTNLSNWTPLVTNPLAPGSLIFTDALATNFPQRFYRAQLQ